jgi:hypothetical protein
VRDYVRSVNNTWKYLAVAALVPFALVACGSDDDGDSGSDVTVPAGESIPAPTDGESCLGSGEAVDGYVGLTEEEATTKAETDGYTLRVVGIDGECQAITMDLREDRVNVEIVDGVVTGAAIF